jgi:hypothetical protein
VNDGAPTGPTLLESNRGLRQPTLIKDGVNPPWVNTKGAPYLNTFLVFVPVVAVPAGFTADNLPAGITFMGRPFDEGTVIQAGIRIRTGDATSKAARHHSSASWRAVAVISRKNSRQFEANEELQREAAGGARC